MTTDAIQVGDHGPGYTFGPLTRTDIVRYAGASNDFNPIHHDEEFARSSGAPSVFAHGMLSAGLLGSYLQRWFGPDRVRRYRVRFVDRVWPGDVLAAYGEVTATGDGSAEVSVRLRRGDDPVVVGDATIDIS